MRTGTIPLVLAFAIVLGGCSSPGSDDAAEDPREFTVTAEMRDITSVLVVDGTVEARPLINVASPAGGMVAVHSVVGAALEASDRLVTVGPSLITSPVLGTLVAMLVSDGETVAANVPIASVRYAGFGVRITVPPLQLYRLYREPVMAKVNVQAGPAGLDCSLAPVAEGAEADGLNVICLLPVDSDVVENLPAKVGLHTGAKKSVVALPVNAVSGSAGQGEVTLVRGEERLVKVVRLGISDGAYVEVLEGIVAGDVVLAYSPRLE